MRRDAVLHNISLLTKYDIYLFKQGNHFRLYERFGAHPIAFYWERPPDTSSIVWDVSYKWNDAEWVSSYQGCQGMSGKSSQI